jgi:hypothetical protein
MHIIPKIISPIIYTILISLSFTLALFAQSPDTLWTKTYGIGSGNSVQQTNDGGYIITGFTHLQDSRDLWLIKTNSAGDTLWTKTFDNEDYETGYSVRQTTDNGYITTGSAGGDVWLIKSNAQGKTLWIKTYGGDNSDTGKDVQETSDGGYIIVGSTRSFGNLSQVWLIKTDTSGDTIWTKTFGGVSTDHGHSVQQTTDGGYIIVGSTGSLIPNNNAYLSDGFIIKTDVNGDTTWTRTFGAHNNLSEYATFGQETSDGGYIITVVSQNFFSQVKRSNILLIKTNINGDTLWTRTFGDSTFNLMGNSVQETLDNGYILIGNELTFNRDIAPTLHDVWLFKTKATGETQWEKALGGDVGTSIQETSDGGYIATGSINDNLWLIKIAPDVSYINDNPIISINTHHLKQNYPNPFNPSTTIEFTLPKSEFVELKVYNLLGKEVSTLVSNKLNQGNHTYTFSGKNLASGIYYYQLTAGDYREVKKMILLR